MQITYRNVGFDFQAPPQKKKKKNETIQKQLQ